MKFLRKVETYLFSAGVATMAISILIAFGANRITIAGKEMPLFILIFLSGLAIFISSGITYAVREISGDVKKEIEEIKQRRLQNS